MVMILVKETADGSEILLLVEIWRIFHVSWGILFNDKVEQVVITRF